MDQADALGKSEQWVGRLSQTLGSLAELSASAFEGDGGGWNPSIVVKGKINAATQSEVVGQIREFLGASNVSRDVVVIDDGLRKEM